MREAGAGTDALQQFDLEQVQAVCEYMEYLPDLPADYRQDRQRLFGY